MNRYNARIIAHVFLQTHNPELWDGYGTPSEHFSDHLFCVPLEGHASYISMKYEHVDDPYTGKYICVYTLYNGVGCNKVQIDQMGDISINNIDDIILCLECICNNSDMSPIWQEHFAKKRYENYIKHVGKFTYSNNLTAMESLDVRLRALKISDVGKAVNAVKDIFGIDLILLENKAQEEIKC